MDKSIVNNASWMFRHLVLWVCLAVLTGCVSTKPQEKAPAAVVTAAPQASTEAVVEPEPDYPVRNFEKDELYQLLVAEMAGYRNDFGLALDKYAEMAIETRDPGVAARATRLAAFLKNDAVTLQSAQIWVDVEPGNSDAQRHSANQLIKSGDLEAAIVHMAAIREMGGPANFDIFAYHSNELDVEGRAGLLAAIETMLQTYPGDPQLRFSQAVLLEQSDRLDEALVITGDLLADAQSVNVIILRVNLLKRLQSNEAAVDYLGEQLAVDGENRRLRLIYARLLFEVDRLDDSRLQYEAILQQSPTDGDILFALALIALEQQNNALAEDYLQLMVRWRRRAGEAHFYLGNIAEQRGDAVTAIKEYRQAGQGYEYLPSQARIATLLMEQGRLYDASRYLANERVKYPVHRDQLIIVEAQLLSTRGMEEALFTLLDNSLEAAPENIDLLYFRGMSGERFGSLDILERDFRRIIEIDPENSEAMNALGYTLADKTDRYAEAQVLIERALAIKPDEAAYIDSIGWVEYRLENYEAAIKHLRRALSLFNNDEVAAHLGEVLWVSGEEEEAREVWNKALEVAPESDILLRVIEQFTQ
ncbi:MAG: tetratricopeptide (TPR) repeat protein [Candidatus Azotimanducaceae bacterium]